MMDQSVMKNVRGFTIVELLIVIVVIAILAAITIVAYNGIQNQARDTQYKTDAVAIVKVAEAINADKGWYPGGTGDTTTVNSSSTLVTSFGAASTAKLPNGVTVTYLAGGGTEPTSTATLKSAADGNPRSYTVEVCGGTNGVSVYYPKIAGSDAGVKSASAGPGCDN